MVLEEKHLLKVSLIQQQVDKHFSSMVKLASILLCSWNFSICWQTSETINLRQQGRIRFRRIEPKIWAQFDSTPI